MWQVGIIGTNHVKMIDGMQNNAYAKTIGGRYLGCGIIAIGDDRGMVENRQLQFCNGMEVAITHQKGEQRLSVNSFVGILSLQTVRGPAIRWPLVEGTLGVQREVSLTEQCVIPGNKVWQNAVMVPGKMAGDTVWRSTPVTVRRELVGELRDGFVYTPTTNQWKKVI